MGARARQRVDVAVSPRATGAHSRRLARAADAVAQAPVRKARIDRRSPCGPPPDPYRRRFRLPTHAASAGSGEHQQGCARSPQMQPHQLRRHASQDRPGLRRPSFESGRRSTNPALASVSIQRKAVDCGTAEATHRQETGTAWPRSPLTNRWSSMSQAGSANISAPNRSSRSRPRRQNALRELAVGDSSARAAPGPQRLALRERLVQQRRQARATSRVSDLIRSMQDMVRSCRGIACGWRSAPAASDPDPRLERSSGPGSSQLPSGRVVIIGGTPSRIAEGSGSSSRMIST